MVGAFCQLAAHTTTEKAVKDLALAICCITSGPTQTTKDAFATPAVVTVFGQLASHATSDAAVMVLTGTICDITNGKTQATKDAFATPAMVGAFCQLAARAATEKAVKDLALTICCITSGPTQTTKDAFATPAIVAAFCQVAARVTSDDCVFALTHAICCITSGTTQTTKDAFGTPAMVGAFCLLASHATTEKAVTALTWAIRSIAMGPTQTTKDAFVDPAIVPSLRGLLPLARTPNSEASLRAALALVSAVRSAPPSVLGVDFILKQALIVFPADYRPTCGAQEAIERCGLKGVTNLPLIAREAAAVATNRLENLLVPDGPPRLPYDQAVAIAGYTYDLGFASADPTGAGSDNLFYCLNAALHQRAHDGSKLLQLKSFLYYLFRGLEALPAAVDHVVYRGVPASCVVVVRQLYLTGANVYWTTFTSSSEDISTAVEFATKEGPGGVIFRITSISGRYVKWYSSMPREGEVIFSPNSTFFVAQGPHDEVLPNGMTMLVVNLTERRQKDVVY